MDPPNKRRKLAPKVPDPPPQQLQPSHPSQFPPDQGQAQSHTAPSNFPQSQIPQAPDASIPTANPALMPAVAPIPAPAPVPERQGFEAFARHLQDAAMMIWRQTQKSPYTDVSVLLMRWEEDVSVEPELAALEQTFRERYNYNTERWNIPTVANPPIKLGVQMASFLENARPDHLLIIYYAGYSYVSADNQLYWACDAREDAARLKWHGVRCLFEDAQSDVLLLLDSAAVKDMPMVGNQCVKQAIAAYAAGTPDQNTREQNGRSFTSFLNEALHKLSSGRPASVQRLYDEIMSLRHHDLQSRMTNGSAAVPHAQEKFPIWTTLTPGKGRTLTIAPLPPKNERLGQPGLEADGRPSTSREDQLIEPSDVADLCFDEPRVLVCTTYIGESGPDMASFNQWVANGPPIASKISVEGMFLGPPTILIIAMPMSLWNMVQHDKVCVCLGYVNSQNITPLYHRLVGSVAVNTTASAKDVEDGRILLEAREAATSSPAVHRHDHDPQRLTLYPETPSRQPAMMRNDPSLLGQLSATSLAAKDDVEDSDEMKEAAEQLKALSHIRHRSDETSNMNHMPVSLPPAHLEHNPHSAKREETVSSHGANESGMDEMLYNNADYSTPVAMKPKRALQKQTPKQETQCNLCSHAPFKDSSSLRKHIAAAHTRPFPCAFSFAGCTSTFGSKNEWKRHIASQHLCLQYYRCSDCSSSSAESKNNEFNRKDLFTQHLRRMHAPFSIKKNLNKDNSKVVSEWEQHVKTMQKQCLVERRLPPQRSACPKPDCQSSFEGPGSWDEWTEHVGRHMEKGEGDRLGVDRLLAQWALEEGVIEQGEDGEYRICNANGIGGLEKSMNRGDSSLLSQQDDDTPPTLAGEDEASLLMASAKAAASAVEAAGKGVEGRDEAE